MPHEFRPVFPPLAFDFVTVPKIVFGWGRRRELGALARPLGARAFVVPGSRTLASAGEIGSLCENLRASGIEASLLSAVAREPTIEDIDAAVASLRAYGARSGDFVVGIGGGAALDSAKALAALAPQPGNASVRDYLEGIGRGLQFAAEPLPWLAMPTTGGTGAEATKNAVISSADPPVKKSLRHDAMLARVALVDPELSATVPATTTAWTGLDAITQCIESYISKRRRPMAQVLARDGLRHGLAGIGAAVRDGTLRWAREQMAYSALLSGLALANSGLGMAHGVAAALGAHVGAPHGLACAAMLPAALRTNLPACQPELAELADFTLGEPSAEALVTHIEGLCRELGVPRRLRELGVRDDQLDALVADSRGNSMSGNPAELSDDRLHRLLAEML